MILITVLNQANICGLIAKFHFFDHIEEKQEVGGDLSISVLNLLR